MLHTKDSYESLVCKQSIIGPIATAHTYKKQLPIESQQPIFYPVMIGIIVSVVTVAVSFILILLSVIGI